MNEPFASVEVEEVPYLSINTGDVVTINGRNWLTVWAVADNLANGTRTGLRFVERDDNGRRLYVSGPNATLITRVKKTRSWLDDAVPTAAARLRAEVAASKSRGN
jgi:hypothetical protein